MSHRVSRKLVTSAPMVQSAHGGGEAKEAEKQETDSA